MGAKATTSWTAVTAKTFDGGSRNDLLGQAGDDKLEGERGDGNDTLKGGSGKDQLEGGPGNDRLDGEPGHDVLIGDDGAEWQSPERRARRRSEQ